MITKLVLERVRQPRILPDFSVAFHEETLQRLRSAQGFAADSLKASGHYRIGCRCSYHVTALAFGHVIRRSVGAAS